jgi:phosphonate transport system substrate-binding protein
MATKKQYMVYGLALAAIAVFTYLSLNSRSKPLEMIKIEGGTSAISSKQDTSQQKPLYIGFIPQGNAVFMVRKWQPLADYLSKELGVPVEMVFRSSYREIITALSNGEMDICLTGAFMYVLTRDAADIRPLVRRKKFGSSSYHSVVIVRKDSKLQSFKDLKNKTFAFTDKESTTGYLLPVAMMRQKGISDPEKYFSEVIYTGNHDSVLLAVYNRSVDAAVMSTTRWRPENPKIQDLRVIWKSEPIFLGPFSVRGGLEGDLVARIKDAFLKIGRTPATRELSSHIQIEGFEEAADRDYDSIRKARKWVF